MKLAGTRRYGAEVATYDRYAEDPSRSGCGVGRARGDREEDQQQVPQALG
jgi:hypothetical protein